MTLTAVNTKCQIHVSRDYFRKCPYGRVEPAVIIEFMVSDMPIFGAPTVKVGTNWSALTEFLKCEQVPVDNNLSEASLRIVALSRKNSLFVGHDEAGENLARVLTMAVTCQVNGVNPLEYLADILLRIQTWPKERIADLLPDSWQRLKDAGELPPINAG